MKKLNNTIEYARFFGLGENYKPDNVIRKGDLVRVVNPEVFVRCGYPMTINSSREEVGVRYKEALYRFLKELDKIDKAENENYCWLDGAGNRTYDSIMRVLAERNLKKKKFGGVQRRIHTETMPLIEGRFYNVLGKFNCVTGDYCSASGWYDDYEPAGLANSQVHVILKLIDHSGIKIEAKNVKKIHGNKDWEICRFVCGNYKYSRCSTEMLDSWCYCEEDCRYKLEHEVLRQDKEMI